MGLNVLPRRGLAVAAVAAAAVTSLLAAPAATASRQVAAAPQVQATGTGGAVSGVTAPAWQTNNTVWAIAAAHGVVYVGGAFTSVRPPGDASGTGEVARSYLAAFDAGTGSLLSFNHTLDGSVTALAVSPDGSTVYAGGSFTHVDGKYRPRLAAFSTATGALSTTWVPKANSTVQSIALSPDGSSIYLGGSFTTLDGQARTRLAAVSSAGSLLAWAPTADGTVASVAVAPDDSRVLIGGYFNTFDGTAQHAIGSADPVTGANEPWAATILPHTSSCTSTVKDIVVQGSTAYVAAEGTGGGCFDGDFAANISDGALIWQNDCLGATQALVIINGWLYKGSHAHDCAFSPGGWPQVNTSHGHLTRHLLDQSLTDGTLGHWTPNTSGNPLGPRVMATDGSQLFVGGDFKSVNGKAQQGFARFPAGPDTTAPGRPAQPVAISTSAGVDSVTFPAVSDVDSGTLTYSLYRDGGKTRIGTVTATSWPWALPLLHYRDAGLTPGSSHTYQVRVSDGVRNSPISAASAPVTVASASPSQTYSQAVAAEHPSFYWRLGESSGTTAADSSGNGFTGGYGSGVTLGQPGAITGDADTAAAFSGTSSGLVSASAPVPPPATFTIEAWFKTTTNTGGKLVGFGNAQSGSSSSYDRHIYMMNDGQLVFGVWTGKVVTIETANTYNDGQWHYVVATLSPATGMALYVDGRLAGTNANTVAQSYSGYWRVGGDNLNGWNLDPWGSNSQGTTQPYGYYFQGTMDEVAVYPVALSAGQVAAHYAANALSH